MPADIPVYALGDVEVDENQIAARISGATPAATAVAFATYEDEANPLFGWGFNADSLTGYRGFAIAPDGEAGMGLLSASLARRGKPGPLFWTPAEELPQGVYNYFFSQRAAFWVTPSEGPFHHFYILGDTDAISFPAQGEADYSVEIGPYFQKGVGAGPLDMLAAAWVLFGVASAIWVAVHESKFLPYQNWLMSLAWPLLALMIGPFGIPFYRLAWLAQSPGLLKKFSQRLRDRIETDHRWTFDVDRWKPTTGLDELVFFWNNLPKASEVELYLPAASVEEIFNFRSLRHAPDTVRIVDSQTLRLLPTGTTFLPLARFWGTNLAGLLTVKLPPGIKKGQRFKVDVLQMRADEARALGGFQLNIQVEKAIEIWESERRTLELFHKRLSVKPQTDRWRPIVARQVEFTRARAQGLVDLANEENPDRDPIVWTDPAEAQDGKKVRVVLERIQIEDDREPFFKGKGEFRFFARAWTPDNGGTLKETVFPASGHFSLGDAPGRNELALDAVLFEDWVEGKLALHVGGVELDTFDPDDRLLPFKYVLSGDPDDWFSQYGPAGDAVDLFDLDGWKIWLRVEPAG